MKQREMLWRTKARTKARKFYRQSYGKKDQNNGEIMGHKMDEIMGK